jgi:hypothetical protein
MPVARAIEGDGGFAMFMAVSAVAAAGGAACTSVGDRSMRNYLKFCINGIKYFFIYIRVSRRSRRTTKERSMIRSLRLRLCCPL